MSVNRTVASARSTSTAALEPVRNSSTRSPICAVLSPMKAKWSIPGSST
jgi:hypothetical protein